MQNELFNKPVRRHVGDLNIVPIIDVLVTVIFFLLLSTSFDEYNKVSVPPATVSVRGADAATPLPLHPRLSVTHDGKRYRVKLSWTGRQPGSMEETLEYTPEGSPLLLEKTQALVHQLKERFPDEKTLQIGLGGHVSYQDLVSVMDAAREDFADIVLVSYLNVDNRAIAEAPAHE